MRKDSMPDIDIKRHWAIVEKRKYLALSVALAVLSLFTWGSFFLPKSYEANSTVVIERSSLINPLISGVGVPTSMDERLRSIRNSMTSRNILEKVIKKIDPGSKSAALAQYEDMIEAIKKALKVTVVASRETDLFTVSYTGSDPRSVRDFVNTLVKEYIDQNVGFRKSDIYGAYAFIESELLEYKKRLDESDRTIREFREKNPQMVPLRDTVMYTRMEGFQTARIESEIRLKELLRKKEALQQQLSGEKELTVAFVTREGSPQARLNNLNNQLMLLATKYTESYPEVIRVRAEMEELKKQMAQPNGSLTGSSGSETSAINPIYQQLREELAKTGSEAEALRARLSELSRQQQEAQSLLGRMPKEQEEWSRLQRDRNVYQKIYDDLLQKLESARVSKDLERTEKTDTFKVVDPAVLPLHPVKPNRVRLILLGVLLGIASGIGAAYGLDRITHSFKDEASLERDLGFPVLASIPSIITEADALAERTRDRKVFVAAGAYLFIIGIVLIGEVLRRYMGIGTVHF